MQISYFHRNHFLGIQTILYKHFRNSTSNHISTIETDPINGYLGSNCLKIIKLLKTLEVIYFFN